MKKTNGVKGFKVFNPDWTCRGFQYEVGQTYEEDVEPVVCDRGFHFCVKASDCFNYYSFSPANKVAEVIALGAVDSDSEKSCTNKIQIVREIPWDELLCIVNTGKNCTGYCNTGNCNNGDKNTGNYNTGDRNNGDRNTGNRNSGSYNTGNRNTGNSNAGDRNTGDSNTGDRNIGDKNTGNYNTGSCNNGDNNTGNKNIGSYNTGDSNTGDSNTGNRNNGDSNTGYCNTGNHNTGDWNIGNYNTGDWNIGDWNTGCFNTAEQKIIMFNKPSGWTYKDWLCSDAKHLLDQMPRNVVEYKWIYSEVMTNEEKVAHPTYETTGGYLKVLDKSKCGQIWWDSLSEYQHDVIKVLPNFDEVIFEEITGIKVSQDTNKN